MKTIRRMLLRDLAGIKGQVAATAVVIAAGVMTLLLAVTTLDVLSLTRDKVYQQQQFAQVFADLKRAPAGLAARLREIPGVQRVETRVVIPVRLAVPGFADPVRGQLISLPDGRQPEVNRLYLRQGSLPAPERSGEVLISEPFADAHDLHPGDRLRAIIQGRLQVLTVAGVALSPEFVYQLGPADILPDYRRFGIFWMNQKALANAAGLDGAFNNVVLTLQAGSSPAVAIEALDAILAPYGGLGAYGRDLQVSHRFFSQELEQLGNMAIVLPAVFLGVSAFLLNVLMGRIIRTQRQQMAVLKAFGYRNREIGLHYALFTGLIVLPGVLLGVGLGVWAAEGMVAMYREYFRFPQMQFRLQPGALLLAVGVAGAAAALGTVRAVYGAVSLAPAEAMRPPAPVHFRQGWLAATRLARLLAQPNRIILRNLGRYRLKAALSVLGISLSAALLLVGSFQFGAVDNMLDVQYRLVQQMDVSLLFSEPAPERALAELRHQPGVRHVEPFRTVAVRLSHGRREYHTSILGMEAEPGLRRLVDRDYRPVVLPPAGLVLTDFLADYLGVRVGDRLLAEIREGHRRTLWLELAATVSEPVGVSAYMERRALNRLMQEGPAMSGAWLLADTSQYSSLVDGLWRLPRVVGISQVAQAESAIRAYIGDTVLLMMAILLLLAGSIAFAVVYNNARIAFAERSRELATLRVLGFTRGEVAWILVGEIAVLSLLAIPLGWLLGTGFAWLLNRSLTTLDVFRLPFIITPGTYAFAALGVGLASILSVLLILRRLHRLDMVSALKTVE